MLVPDAPARLSGAAGLTGHPAFGSITAAPPGAFRATVQRAEGRLVTTELTRLSPCRLEQAGDPVDPDPADEKLHAAVADTASTLRLCGGAVQIECAAGHLVLYSPHRELDWTFTEPTRLAVLSAPARLVDQRGEGLRRTGATVLDTPFSAAAAEFVTQFVVDTTRGSRPIGVAEQQAVVDLIGGALAQQRLADDYVLAAVRERIDRDFACPDLSASTIAEGLSMSLRQLYRYFTDTGITVAGLITERRLDCARTLLQAPETVRLAEIAAASGFRSVGTFRRRFEAVVGQTPSAYREQALARRRLDPDFGRVLVESPERGPRRPGRPVTAAYDYV
ncbi:helix-turn-helix domain-containing protein [Gordonia alkaliphila]|uniref:HTH araC/xylS-type domain-containing protein n=1 Tax=Gordonia alkaliphila TaxID=1053547 RepID=A0ABP8Z9N2_9ACTN